MVDKVHLIHCTRSRCTHISHSPPNFPTIFLTAPSERRRSVPAAPTAFAPKRRRSAPHRRRQEGRPFLPRHDHQEFLFHLRRRRRLRVRLLGGAGLEILPVAAAGELPVGARQDEEREGNEAEHRRQAAEKVRHRRVPRRPLRRRR
ncbi:nuclear factor Y [Striga asiatica]|uniref:Nuclear factor Y n=1 Tax=Striga asiatica TaxID=4170 RepID=A0A5A7R585_STRAF|nr:nuclear factor Y [Striga asiatica]